MNKKDAENRILVLRKEIEHHRYQYHVLDNPEISDEASDSLKHELVKLEEQFPELKTEDSPSQRVSGEVLEKFEKVKHVRRQWSLNDAFSVEELEDWEKRLKKLQPDASFSYYCEPKIDGLHIVLTYTKGVLTAAATRGNGLEGENVTHNIRTIESIPLRLSEDIDIVVEGEVYIEKKTFEELNIKRVKEGKELFANPRNAAAGAIRQLDSKIVAQRELSCIIYDIVYPDSAISQSQDKESDRLKELGFKINPQSTLVSNISDVDKYWKKTEVDRDTFDYWIDGAVVKVNSSELQGKLGYTGKAPRWALALKFAPEEVTSILREVVLNVGRTGKVTPVATIDPVQLAGTTVAHASLHNFDEVERLDVRIGDTVVVKKAGDIIPQIVEVLKRLRPKSSKPITAPKTLPGTEIQLHRPEGEVNYYVKDASGWTTLRHRLGYFVSKAGLDIDGLGKKKVEQLIDEGLVREYSDFYNLKKQDLMELDRFAEKSADNLIESIQNTKSMPLETFIRALGIKHLGQGGSDLIAQGALQDKELRNPSDIVHAVNQLSVEDVELIDGIGPKAAQSFCDFFTESSVVKQMQDLEKAGIMFENDELQDTKLGGKSFLFTGTLESISRSEAQKRVKEQGGKAAQSISKGLTYLVIGKSPGSKLEKAQGLGIKILTEQEFLAML